MSIYKVTQQSKTTVVVTMFALAFTLSSLPGIKGQTLEDNRSDLSSFVSCDIDGQIKADGNADCRASIKSEKSVTSKVHIEYVAKTETSEAAYLITGELSVKCSICEKGVRSTDLNQQVKSISEIQDYIDDQAETLATDTKKDEDTENCKIDENGQDNNKAERLQCLIARMDGMDEKEARKFYDNKIKGELAALAESQNPQDAILAAQLASELHTQMGVNCASQVAMAQQANMMSQTGNPFNIAAPPAGGYSKSTPTDYIKESSCDIMMMANFNGRMNMLGQQLKGPNAMAAAKQIQDLQGSWGGYFAGRGFNLQSPMMNQINMDAGSLMTQMNDFNKQFTENYESIVKRHSDILGQEQQQQAKVNGNGNPTGDLRLLRGGAPLPENSNGGTPSVTPFPAYNGNGANTGMNSGFTMPQKNPNAPAVIAPRADSPVGG